MHLKIINKLILKSQQIFRIEKHNVFTEEVNKIALTANNSIRIQSVESSVDSREAYAYGTNDEIMPKKKKICVST